MTKPIRILLQTTIPYAEDNWHVGRFSLLRDELSSMKDPQGNQLCAVTTRNREADSAGSDPVLSTLDKTDFDELWLFAIDNGDGLSVPDCQGITRFRQRGGGIMATRDHQDLGISLCTLGGIGRAHFFHSKHPEPDADRHVPDDKDTSSISWPNYHSGANGDYQTIAVTFPHELLRRNASADNLIEFFPAHPHEGAVGVPEGEDHARVIATGKSEVTGRPFNLVVAFESSPDEHGNTLGRGIAESSFHHFADYNWNTDMGCPSFLEEPPGDGYKRNPQALEDIKTYVRNAAVWLSRTQS
ncbi:MAG: hypothetical protein QOG23_1476 [Blastocatellia bacterium]|jgi:hypothetical protein|nr:hypothetical protein [Blastocatellia bacterium]